MKGRYGWKLAAVAATGLALATAAEPSRPPVAVLYPADNPLAKRGGRVPAPTIVWEDFRVRPDHPRLLFNRDTLPALYRRIVSAALL